MQHLEDGRGNRVPTRNQRLGALHTFFEYVGARAPEVFGTSAREPLTRFGIYKRVRRHTARLQDERSAARRIGPHVLRHTTAVHLLEAGVEST